MKLNISQIYSNILLLNISKFYNNYSFYKKSIGLLKTVKIIYIKNQYT